MYSGKTTELMRRIKRHHVINNQTLIINSASDIRCQSEICSHDNHKLSAIKLNNLNDIFNDKYDIDSYNVIAIDEAQFFEDLVTFTQRMLNINKHIIVAGLNGDYKQNVFGNIVNLIPWADKLDLLDGLCTLCADGASGYFSSRIIEDKSQVLVGGKESYICVCRKHLN